MSFGNVIPIDAEVAQQLARRQVRFRWLVAGLTALWLAVLVPTLVLTPLPPLTPFLALAVLVVLAEHRFVLFGDETSMSASIIVVVASIFVFADTAPLAGPLLIASIAGLYLPHLRAGAFTKVAFNGTGMGLAAWAASITAIGVDGLEQSPLGALLAVAATLAAYWTLNNVVVAGHQATVCGQRYTASAVNLIASDTEVLVWAAAACLGTISANDPSIAGIAFVAAVVGCHIALRADAEHRLRDSGPQTTHQDAVLVWFGSLALLASRGTPSAVAVALLLSVVLVMPTFEGHPCRLISVGVPIAAVLALNSGTISVCLALIAPCALLALGRGRGARWTACVAIGAVGFVILTRANVLTLRPGSPLAIAAATVLPPLLAMVTYAVRSHWMSKTVGFWTTLGIAIPSPLHIAVGCYIIGTAALAETAPVVALGTATSVIAIRCALRPIVPRSWARASH